MGELNACKYMYIQRMQSSMYTSGKNEIIVSGCLLPDTIETLGFNFPHCDILPPGLIEWCP